jgi:hypothetical protein
MSLTSFSPPLPLAGRDILTKQSGVYSYITNQITEGTAANPPRWSMNLQEAQRTLYESLCGVWKGYEPPGVDLCLDYRQRFLLSSMMALAPRQVGASCIHVERGG